VGGHKEEIIAVICFTSKKKRFFNLEATNSSLSIFSQKVEILLYCEELSSRIAGDRW
jgi:hypothetical protein